MSYSRLVGAISERDAASLLEVIHAGASERGQESFPASVLWALSRLIPSDACVGYEETDIAASRFRVLDLLEIIGEPPSPRSRRRSIRWGGRIRCTADSMPASRVCCDSPTS